MTDTVLKFGPSFTSERSFVTEVAKFLDCVFELSSRVPEGQKDMLLRYVENRLFGDAYYRISSS